MHSPDSYSYTTSEYFGMLFNSKEACTSSSRLPN
jgi:hypothetical protein